MYLTQQALLQSGFVQRGSDYTRKSECEKLFAEGEKCCYKRSAKHAVVIAIREILPLFKKLKKVLYDEVLHLPFS
jgi:hypothetical protein